MVGCWSKMQGATICKSTAGVYRLGFKVLDSGLWLCKLLIAVGIVLIFGQHLSRQRPCLSSITSGFLVSLATPV